MCGEMTDKETIQRVDECLEQYTQDQFEILLYKKNRTLFNFFSLSKFIHLLAHKKKRGNYSFSKGFFENCLRAFYFGCDVSSVNNFFKKRD
jgi:hypothetical protein